MIIKAKIKQLSHISPDELCCELKIKWFEDQNNKNEIFEVDPSIQEYMQLECLHCDQPSSALMIRVINSSQGSGWGQLDLYDLEEGAPCPSSN